jgi:hypothetical protein
MEISNSFLYNVMVIEKNKIKILENKGINEGE